ncbi:MFS transporter [Thaumasiovibrio subtropicus]|uniref:MFS transporter n=1 Tax=Thaumasiovibrio subtropicus TaxID=1891207 RepID=UPI000B35A963|nr:MFS transporter [Thaumasiovibrio subtropicus]
MRGMNQQSRLILGSLLVVLSLSLILVVGYAQALKSYQQLAKDAVLSQTEAARIGIQQILSSGVPLHDIAGLQKVLSPIADSDVSVVDLRLIAGDQELYRYTNELMNGSVISVPLSNKFVQVGTLEILLSDNVVKQAIHRAFQPLLWLVAGLVVLFIFVVVRGKGQRYLLGFSLAFIAMAFSVMLLVGSLFKDGLESKANSMANVILQRLEPVMVLDIEPDMITGLDEMLSAYREVNTELSSVTVYREDQTIAHSDDGSRMGGLADYHVRSGENRQVSLSFHPEVLLSQLLKIIKSFAILFGGCAFICFAFVKLLNQPLHQSNASLVLEQIKPLFLMTVLMESMMAPTLPNFLGDVALSAGMPVSASSWFFTVYFVGFALTLLPASRLTELLDVRSVLISGVVLAALGCLLLALRHDLTMILVARLLAGIGQAMVFIAVQSYILRYSDATNKTQAAGIIVFCFNAGFIAGAAIGALLTDFLGERGVFLLSSAVGVGMVFFSFILPTASKQTRQVGSAQSHTLRHHVRELTQDAWRLLSGPSFLRTMLLVGIPTKMMLTGVVTFAVPLLLAQAEVSKESIGQVLMVYAAAVLFISQKVSPIVDKLGSSKTVLCLGSLTAAISLAVLSLALSLGPAWAIVSLTTGSMLIMGISHGLINAPVVTHVVNNVSGESDTTVAATYRFLERIGHVLGAIVVGSLLTLTGNADAFWILGAFFVAAAIGMYLFEGKTQQEGISHG